MKDIKEYQITKKYIKLVQQEIIFLGFPDSILEQILKSVETIHVSSLNVIKKETIIEIKGFADTQGFEKWKKGIKLKEETRQKNNVEVIRLLIRLLRDLRQIGVKKFVKINNRIENVSKQFTGWQRSVN